MFLCGGLRREVEPHPLGTVRPAAGVVTLSLFRASLTIVLLLATLAQCLADPAHVIHYAPAENLERIDVALIDRAEHEIDLAAYVLTDWPVMQALTRAADRRQDSDLSRWHSACRARANEGLSGPRRDARRRDSDQTQACRANAPQELLNRQALAAHRRRELFRIWPQAAGQ